MRDVLTRLGKRPPDEREIDDLLPCRWTDKQSHDGLKSPCTRPGWSYVGGLAKPSILRQAANKTAELLAAESSLILSTPDSALIFGR